MRLRSLDLLRRIRCEIPYVRFTSNSIASDSQLFKETGLEFANVVIMMFDSLTFASRSSDVFKKYKPVGVIFIVVLR